MRKTQTVKYGEEVCFNGMLMLKASSSGLELGNCVWSIKGPRASITYLPSTLFVSAHALDCDYNSLKEKWQLAEVTARIVQEEESIMRQQKTMFLCWL